MWRVAKSGLQIPPTREKYRLMPKILHTRITLIFHRYLGHLKKNAEKIANFEKNLQKSEIYPKLFQFHPYN